MLGLVIIVLTFGAFAYYLTKHPAVVDEILSVHPATTLLLLVLYIGMTGTLMLVLSSQLLLYKKTMGVQENFLLNAYSSLINFFGPGQSGPGLRAIYLKKKYGVKLRQYFVATLLYYACFAVISACFAFIGSRPWWQTVLVVLAAAGMSAGVIYWATHRRRQTDTVPISKLLISLFLATLLQLVLQAIIFYVELRSIDNTISVSQVITYTGVANFALFVALTPGAIGIRESFLLFSEGLHHISHGTVIAASVLDRAVYLVFLGVLFMLVISMHAKKRLHRTLEAETPNETGVRAGTEDAAK